MTETLKCIKGFFINQNQLVCQDNKILSVVCMKDIIPAINCWYYVNLLITNHITIKEIIKI